MEHALHPRPGYPFSLALAIEYRLSDEGLVVQTTATNVGSRACPFGSGAHPYLSAGTPTVDSAVLHVPAGTVLQANERGIPVGEIGVEGTDYDFRQRRPIGTTLLDHCFTDLERDGDGIARVTLQDADGADCHCGWTRRYPYLMLFTGDPLPDVARRSLAVEPMTCPPNAFRTGRDLIRLAAWPVGLLPVGHPPLEIGGRACLAGPPVRRSVARLEMATAVKPRVERTATRPPARSPPTCSSCSASPATSRR